MSDSEDDKIKSGDEDDKNLVGEVDALSDDDLDQVTGGGGSGPVNCLCPGTCGCSTKCGGGGGGCGICAGPTMEPVIAEEGEVVFDPLKGPVVKK